jgi:hypothetical protein
MTAKQIERAAYIAAHRIVEASNGALQLACPGARRTYAVDRTAEIIREAFGAYSAEERETANRAPGLDEGILSLTPGRMYSKEEEHYDCLSGSSSTSRAAV